MSPARASLRAFGVVVAALLATTGAPAAVARAAPVPVAAPPAAAPAAPRETKPPPPATAPAGEEQLAGTYELLAKDRLDGHGHLHDHYTEVLRVAGKRAIPLSLPYRHGLRAGTRIRVSAQRSGDGTLVVRSFQRLAPASTIGSAGTSSVLVVLAYWSKPDAVTPARAREQFFGDDDRWFREVSYGRVGLAGAVTPWVRIAAPTPGRCYAESEQIFANATTQAAALGDTYDYARYDRVVIYFPRCSTGDTAGVAGWAYQPGTVSWLNGYMDRRTSVHEQGHNFGLGHARSYRCRSAAGSLVTLGSSCVAAEYGDAYDAMGRSSYVAHFTGYRKDRAGWLGSRKRVLSSSSATTFTLPPFEKPSTAPLVVVANSPKVLTRSYWLEYRRPVGMDARLPSGATGGVLIHLVDTGKSGWLLDGSPKDGTMSTAVLRPATSWTSPDGVKIAVGTASSTGVRVTVTGARPPVTNPSVPRNVVTTPRDGQAYVSWDAPTFNGNSALTGYDVVAAAPGVPSFRTSVGALSRTTPLWGLSNGTRYTVTVVAKNAQYSSAPATTYVTPVAYVPSVRLTAPAAGAVLRGITTINVEATPHPQTGASIWCISVFVGSWWGDERCDGGDSASFQLDTVPLGDGTHTVVAEVRDTNGRTARTAPISVTVNNPEPQVRITAPVRDTVYPDVEQLSFEAAATVPEDPAMAITGVTYYDVTSGYFRQVAHATAAPFAASVPVSHVEGVRSYVAVARAANGRETTSDIVSVTVRHPATTVTVTSPAAGSTVQGTTVRLAADAAVAAAGSTPEYLEFYVGGQYAGRDTTAPYELDWDIASTSGSQSLTVRLRESTGRETTKYVQFTVGNVLPVVRVTAPSATVPAPGVVRLAGSAQQVQGGEAPDRVELRVNGAVVGTAPVVDGSSWSYDWNAPAYGRYEVVARGYTPSGLYGTASRAFEVYRPLPVTIWEAPEYEVANGTTVDVVIAVTPGTGDVRTVSKVCFYVYYEWTYQCATATDAAGKWRIPWRVERSRGSYYLDSVVVMSDGTEHRGATRTVYVT